MAEDPKNLKWFIQAELVNNGWAMLRHDKRKAEYFPSSSTLFPGGIFNPLNFAPTLEAKEKEIANKKEAGNVGIPGCRGATQCDRERSIQEPFAATFRSMAHHHC
ncbi:hypothetical protein MLD38_039383 [Melastoma candidum]|uniref:Uncharacterized protein n=1 Tax=Melastoma candidum TaxID=119954 RepID=A0ACB9L1W4_9MYRT|nr:hypothetical protein MLD38_039383 [Melastoma candidum]